MPDMTLVTQPLMRGLRHTAFGRGSAPPREPLTPFLHARPQVQQLGIRSRLIGYS